MEDGCLNIMIAEDEAAHAEAIRRAFVSSDLKVKIEQAATLREFFEKVVQSPPDIAIMDLNLPDGQAVEALTAPAEAGAFPILLMTSYGNEQVAVEAIKSGAIDYIVKSPEVFAQLPRIVERSMREWGLLCDRKRAEQEIRESEARFHTLSNQFNTLLDTLPDLFILHDTDRRVIWANRAAKSASANFSADLSGAHCFTLWHNNAVPCDVCPVMKSLHTGESAIEIVNTSDGKAWELRAIPVKENGRVVSVIEVARDISEHRRLEDQLMQSRKMDAVGRLAGGVAHDFNNMLNVILGYTDMALNRISPENPVARRYLQEVINAGKRSADLTGQLLAFSRKQVVEPQVLDLNKVVAGQIKLFGKLIGEDIELHFFPGIAAGPLWIDPSQIDQILINLIVNARDAIEGAGNITIRTANVALDAEYCRDHPDARPEEYVRLSVSDTGCGMDAATVEQIFEPFFTTKEKGKGTGLGLATVYGIVQQNNGEIHAESEPGKGTTFTIHIPVVRCGPAQSPDLPDETIARGSETILLVEDDQQNLDVTRLLLEESGYRVIATSSPREACNLCERHSAEISMLLSDVVMPELNGRELLVRISAINPDIKTLFMSGYTDDVIATRGIIPEGINFIHKPFTITRLAGKVRAVLDAPQGVSAWSLI